MSPPEPPDRSPRVLAVIAVGGVLGAELRYGIGVLLPAGHRSFPWATLLVNVSGGFAIGVLMALLAGRRRTARHTALVRPFVGVGMLGGFTTFSTYSTDTFRLIDAGRIAVALTYAGLTLIGALVATVAGLSAGGSWRRPAPGSV